MSVSRGVKCKFHYETDFIVVLGKCSPPGMDFYHCFREFQLSVSVGIALSGHFVVSCVRIGCRTTMNPRRPFRVSGIPVVVSARLSKLFRKPYFCISTICVGGSSLLRRSVSLTTASAS